MGNNLFHWEEESVGEGRDAFKVKGRKFKLINASGQEIELEIGETFWVVDEATGRNGQNVFFLEQAYEDDKPLEWFPKLCVHLDWDEDIKEYAEEHCWGNLNADEQRMMDECPVIERFAGSGLSTDGSIMCPLCNDD